MYNGESPHIHVAQRIMGNISCRTITNRISWLTRQKGGIMADVLDLLKANTVEDAEVDWESVLKKDELTAQYNEHINGIVAKNVGKQTEKVRAETLTTVLQELGIDAEDIDSAKAYVKTMNGNTDEFKEKYLSTNKQLEQLQNELGTTKSEYESLLQKVQKSERMNTLVSKGVDPDYAEFLEYKLSQQVDESNTWESLVEAYLKENDIQTNNRFRKQPPTPTKDIDPSIRKRYPKYFK